jgi:hypothetical protein
MQFSKLEISAVAAQLVVEEGLDYGAAKHRAAKALGLPARTALPDNDALEDAVVDYIATFCPESQAQELQALRAHFAWAPGRAPKGADDFRVAFPDLKMTESPLDVKAPSNSQDCWAECGAAVGGVAVERMQPLLIQRRRIKDRQQRASTGVQR